MRFSNFSFLSHPFYQNHRKLQSSKELQFKNSIEPRELKSAEDKSATEILVWFSRRVYIYTLYLDCACSQTIRSFDLFISLCIYICGFIKLFTKTSETSGQCKLLPSKRGWDAVRIENGGVRCKDDPAQLAKLFGDFELLNWIPQTLLIISGISAESTLSLLHSFELFLRDTGHILFLR